MRLLNLLDLPVDESEWSSLDLLHLQMHLSLLVDQPDKEVELTGMILLDLSLGVRGSNLNGWLQVGYWLSASFSHRWNKNKIPWNFNILFCVGKRESEIKIGKYFGALQSAMHVMNYSAKFYVLYSKGRISCKTCYKYPFSQPIAVRQFQHLYLADGGSDHGVADWDQTVNN